MFCFPRCIAVRPRVSHFRLLTTTFVDPFGAKDPQRGTVDGRDLEEWNRLVGYSKIIGDPKKGLADDTRCRSPSDAIDEQGFL